MLALPDLGGIQRVYTTVRSDPLAAKLALALAGKGEIRPPRRRVQSVEIDLLQQQLQAWLNRMNADAKFIFPRLHVSLNQAHTIFYRGPETSDDTYTVWIGDEPDELVGTIWHLEHRWKALEARAPGLAAAALNALAHAGLHSFPLYTPAAAEYWACHNWWWGEDDETYILAEYREEVSNPKEPPPDDMPTRAWFDKVLPRCVTRPHSRLKRAGLERHGRRRDDVGEIARRVLELDAVCKAAQRRKSAFEFQHSDDNGFCAVGFSACLRWNAQDPMLQIYDDHANAQANGEGCEDVYGWFAMDNARELPKLLAELEHYFAIVRRIEGLVPLVATRYRP